MMGGHCGVLVAVLGVGALGCASGPAPIPTASQTTLATEERAALEQVPPDGKGLTRFWARGDVQIGIVKWDEKRSHVSQGAPTELLQTLRDEAGRLNQLERAGEEVWLTANVYEWRTPLFARHPQARLELVGRDQAGQVVWMGQGEITAAESLAESPADTPAVIVAREAICRLREELSL